jgi:hypothetical protein
MRSSNNNSNSRLNLFGVLRGKPWWSGVEVSYVEMIILFGSFSFSFSIVLFCG